MPEQIMQDELKPCPFCGGGGAVDHTERGWEPSCETNMECVAYTPFSVWPTRKQAIAAWNTRADQTARNKVIEECAKVADSFEQDGLKKLASADTANSQRNYAAGSVAAQEIAQAIRALKDESQ